MPYLVRPGALAVLLGLSASCVPLNDDAPPAKSDFLDDFHAVSRCTGYTPPAPPPLEMTAVDFTDPTCVPWGCGTNAATVGDGVVFDELDSSLAYNREVSNPLRITGARFDSIAGSGPIPVQLQVMGDKLSAVDGMNRYEGQGLVNLRFSVTAITPGVPPGTHRYELQIVAVHDDSTSGPLNFWTQPGNSNITSYTIVVQTRDSCIPICKNHLAPGESLPPGREYDAITFEGDHYDAQQKQVSGGGPPKFNLACAGAAPAKMHLMRHTQAGQLLPAYPETLDHRQAMLKMFTADYCGNGLSFTVDGQRLLYNDENSWYRPTPMLSGRALPPSQGKLEALWDEHGAICLDEPRPAPFVDWTAPHPAPPPPPIPAVTRGNVETACSHPPTTLPPGHAARPAPPRCTGPGGILSSTAPIPLWHVISAIPPP